MGMRAPPEGTKAAKPRARVLGRSPATGRLVFAPVTKTGSITVAAARKAAEAVRSAREA